MFSYCRAVVRQGRTPAPPAIEALRARCDDSPCPVAGAPIVILLSDPIGDEGLRAGANAVLLKPEDISTNR